MPTLNQVVVGGAAGLAAGYVFSRVGKLAAFSIGSGILVLQVAQHLGYIEVKLTKKSRVEELKRKALRAAQDAGLTSNSTQSQMEKVVGEVKNFLKDNLTLGVSFGGGLLIGFSI
jgi:FUN14 domain-containing protein 1